MFERSTAAALPLVALLATGCGAVVGEAAEETVEEGVEEMAEPATQSDVERILTDQEVQDASQDFVRALVSATREELTEEAQLAAIEDALAQLTERLGGVVGAELRTAAVAVLAQLREGGRELGAELASDEGQQAVQQLGRSLAYGLSQGVADGIRRDVRPAVADMLQEDGLRDAVLEASRSAGYGATVGFDEALEERAEGYRAGDESYLVSRIESAREEGDLLSEWLRWGVLAAVLAFGGLAAILFRQLRKTRREVHRREAALVLLASGLKSTEQQPWSGELREALRRHFRDAEGAEYLREILRQRPDLRLGGGLEPPEEPGEAEEDEETREAPPEGVHTPA